ncbi:MAG TPA: hypothetical protein VKA38_08130 [Draconibacterium sp.]|nr:hypothetical protein [Draconibacterium sp.]
MTEDHPKIVNIINFIRLLEPRNESITEDVLYETVVNQVKMMKEYGLGGTFLLQYDALLNKRYQKLLKSLPDSSFEIGAWWEIPQPLVEHAGMTWRGRFPWDWHANVGFATGYTPEEREKLVDVYMKDFKAVFGYYPKSVGSWFIDAHTLDYLYRKYGIIASCNCKDQVGTDGYTVWGGYWNQAYYPSKKNAYMPAQHSENQIPVPVFRMLGSDPVRQYDKGLGTQSQGVITLEPVYAKGGGDSTWVNWYFNQFVNGACMDFAYVQAGQENSFTWNKMKKGFEIQLPLIARLRNEKKIKVETLAESGSWFKKKFSVTPATSVTITQDLPGSDKQTVWFDSRFYRANLQWDNGTMRFRDIHVFDENVVSDYLMQKGTSSKCTYFTLPFVDGFFWSSKETIAGLRLRALINGKEVELEGDNLEVDDSTPGQLQISWNLKTVTGKLHITMDENGFIISCENTPRLNWFLDLTTAQNANLPFTTIHPRKVECRYLETNYTVEASRGTFSLPGEHVVFRVTPEDNRIILNFSRAISAL